MCLIIYLVIAYYISEYVWCFIWLFIFIALICLWVLSKPRNALLDYLYDSLIITDDEIIFKDRTWLLRVKEITINKDDITKVDVKQNWLLKNLTNNWDIYIYVEDKSVVKLDRVKNPLVVKNLILKTIK